MIDVFIVMGSWEAGENGHITAILYSVVNRSLTFMKTSASKINKTKTFRSTVGIKQHIKIQFI